jgi:hypothetical protein
MNKIVVYDLNQSAKEKRVKHNKYTYGLQNTDTNTHTTAHTDTHSIENSPVFLHSIKENPVIAGANSLGDSFISWESERENMNVKTNKERSKRVITETKRWTFSKEELEYVNQLELLNTLVSLVNQETAGGKLQLTPSQRMVYSQIKTKLRSYKEQDIKKNKLDSLKFVTPTFILNKLEESRMVCFYCKESTSILYEYVREPKQWTIERLDNTYGHNCDNVVIACLSCNLRRRTSQFERYLTTKKICAGIKKLDEIADI